MVVDDLLYYSLWGMVLDDVTLLPSMENDGERSYVITHYWEGWWTIFRYYPLLGMVLEDLTLLPIIESYYLLLGMVVDDLALLNIVGNGGEGPYFITYYFEWWWKIFRYYPSWGMVVDELTLLPIIGNGGEGPYVITNIENGSERHYVVTHYYECWWTT